MEKIAFLFPGQGSQYIGMGRTLYDEFTIARQTFQEADDVLGFSLSELCFSGTMSELNQPVNMQPAMLAFSVAAYRVFMQEAGIAPDVCAGHSLGEYAALTCAGAIRFGDALHLVRQRGALAQQFADTGAGAMTIVDGVQREQIEQWCREAGSSYAAVSCYNASSQFAISGLTDGVYAVEDNVLAAGGSVTPLMMSAPYHCKTMAPVSEKLSEVLQAVKYADLKYPVLSNVTAKPYPVKELIAGRLAEQLVRPVQWLATLQYMKRLGITMTVEFGPKNVLSALVKQELPGVRAFSFDQLADRRELLAEYGSKPEYVKHRPSVLGRMLASAVSTPNTNWNSEAYQNGVVAPYRRIETILEQSERDGLPASDEQLREAFRLLKQILHTKGLSAEEQDDAVHRILDETCNPYLDMELAI
ncbi:hypothetical protein PCCS19_16490 [Paenibacillus sp. CCS19]|uniref:ACP S-malonyltransferase n=1 Tax=Paenibacillus sp. CCS19 TaxID=3158387 RepID=UPI002563C8ED|nr:ACP S-malonyltransferase [Paenibacillus cellulosilyticus]GMK38595.1 hypothetical protein PCCS19_16490 [Paenibacillus cellulosilyticus]